MPAPQRCIAFADGKRIFTGTPGEVAGAVRRHMDAGNTGSICILDAETSALMDFAMQGTPDEVAARAEAQVQTRVETASKARRGRPRLGVIPREVTLLPRHWDWLSAQPGGASVTLRKLVDAARKQGGADEKIRRAQDVTHQFLYAVAGDWEGFEEVSRALYAWDLEKIEALLAAWPDDVRDHTRYLLGAENHDA